MTQTPLTQFDGSATMPQERPPRGLEPPIRIESIQSFKDWVTLQEYVKMTFLRDPSTVLLIHPKHDEFGRIRVAKVIP